MKAPLYLFFDRDGNHHFSGDPAALHLNSNIWLLYLRTKEWYYHNVHDTADGWELKDPPIEYKTIALLLT